METPVAAFCDEFRTLTGHLPLAWQRRLFRDYFVSAALPTSLDLPTGLGKTAVMAIWLIAKAHGAKLPRRLVYIVDQRAVVDQATEEAEKLRLALEGTAKHFSLLDMNAQAHAARNAAELKKRLGFTDKHPLPVSTLRGAYADNREWLIYPTTPAIIVGTVDMIGSRLLFEGYGVSRKMRPYQAGLLGLDVLFVLDEAHLVPPFAHLLRTIGDDVSLRPRDSSDRGMLPPYMFLPLSATQHDLGGGTLGQRFRLKEEDLTTDAITRTRLTAQKHLYLEPLEKKNQDRQLAHAAWTLGSNGGRFFRVAVFCDRRDEKDEGEGPSAERVKDEIDALARANRRIGTEIHSVELLAGARRVRERDGVAKRLRALGFIGEKKPLTKPAFLIATSAGEVGIDVDADQMVSDLVSWERMVQRFGRVNRRGEGDAQLRVFWSKPSIKDFSKATEPEKRALTAFASKRVIEYLPPVNAALDASPGALHLLTEEARSDVSIQTAITSATTPEPLRPTLNSALVEAWSMTTLKVHTGRPDVWPWLRGWSDEDQHTTVVWRTHLPLRGAGTVAPSSSEIENFFELAPLHESEKLQTESYRVANWLEQRASGLLKRKRSAERKDSIEKSLQPGSIVALVLSSGGDYKGFYTLGQLGQNRRGGEQDALRAALFGKSLVIDARFTGLDDGLLNAESDDPVETADWTMDWSRQIGFRVRPILLAGQQPDDEWRFEGSFILSRDDEGKPVEQLAVEHFRDAAQQENGRSVSRPQLLSTHQAWARSEMAQIAKALGISGVAANALAVAAGLHDAGKRAPRWQRAFGAEHSGLVGVLAKTRGPINPAILCGYRHEFGSLRHVTKDDEFKALPEDWRDLVLYLVAAHHGQARPEIETEGCDDGPPSLLEQQARDVALRFARLQKRWGPWGLAWWEALLRAADLRASRRLEDQD
jgi:CRISPR-associated endonuclease/helicase Cas3